MCSAAIFCSRTPLPGLRPVDLDFQAMGANQSSSSSGTPVDEGIRPGFFWITFCLCRNLFDYHDFLLVCQGGTASGESDAAAAKCPDGHDDGSGAPDAES